MEPKKVKEKYRSLDREGLLKLAYDMGAAFEKNSFSCSQSTVCAINEIVGLDDTIVKCATSSCAGSAGEGLGECGAYAGGLMIMDYFFGREAKDTSFTKINEENINKLDAAQAKAKKYYLKYMKEYGTIFCAHIQVQRFGRFYYLQDEDDAKKFNEAGAHTDNKHCLDIVGRGAQMIMELLIDEGAVIVGK